MYYKLKAHPECHVLQSGSDYVFSGFSEQSWLSIKCMFNGSAFYETDDGGHFSVDDNAYLILNKDHSYWIHKDSMTPVETFCVYFPPNWAEDVLRTLVTPSTQLLDSPTSAGADLVSFFEKRYTHDNLVTPHLLQMRARLKHGVISDGWVEELLLLLLVKMLQMQENVQREIANLPPARQSTRAELYYRLQRARDYMHAHSHEPLTVAEIARTAYLSPYHFLRTFKQFFQETPHAYLTRLRLKKARFLLAHTELSVTQVCLEIGFQSVPHFSNLFRCAFGLSPSAFRGQYQTQS